MAEQEQAIQKVNPATQVTMGRAGVLLQNLDELLKFAKMCTENGAAPKGMNYQQAAIAIQAGLERGLTVMAGLQAAIVVNGVLSWRGWAAAGLIQNSTVIVPGTWKSWVEGEGDSRTGYCRAQRKGHAEPFVESFSVKDAKTAKLWNKDGPWQMRPDNMLRWRAVGDMARFHFGDVLGGFPIAEDVEAGGIGPAAASELFDELPAQRQPEPPGNVRDPILVDLVPEKPRDQAAINESVEEAFGVSNGPVPPPAVVCARCQALTNAMGGCDVCGWPGPDLR